jgi:DNA ligase-1
MITKPMLAGKCTDLKALKYPVLATPKLDGIRCLVIKGKAVSRKFKPIPNDYIRQTIEMTCNSMQLDGEIMIEGRNFNDLSGDVRRKDGRPNFKYMVFDYVLRENEKPYVERMMELKQELLPTFCEKILPVSVANADELRQYEVECLAKGYEGVMVRSIESPYKCGRSTENEGYLLKIKRFEDDEAIVIGYEEEMHNDNPATEDAFGRTERSSCKENLVGKGTLGKLICENKGKWAKSFDIGTGFDADTRAKLWVRRGKLKLKVVKFKHQPCGAGERPRFPVFLGFRDEWDL